MNENIYLHAIYAYPNQYNSRQTNNTLKKILSSGAVLSRRKQHLKYTYGFNGLDYISLCDYSKRMIASFKYQEYTSYLAYIRESLSLIFPKENLKAITPRFIQILNDNKEKYFIMSKLGLSQEERFSDLLDEVQIKDELSLEFMSGITVPLHKMNNQLFSEYRSAEIVLRELEDLKQLLLKYNYDVPIYDIDTKEELNDDINTRKLIKSYYRSK